MTGKTETKQNRLSVGRPTPMIHEDLPQISDVSKTLICTTGGKSSLYFYNKAARGKKIQSWKGTRRGGGREGGGGGGGGGGGEGRDRKKALNSF